MSYIVDDSRARIDSDVVWGALREAYWGKWRSREDVESQIRDAWRVIGVYEEQTGAQVGFARAVSDGLGFAYLADVIVVEAHRGNGLGKRIVQSMIDDGPGAHFRWTLFTNDAHRLYEQFGFAAPGPTKYGRFPRRWSMDNTALPVPCRSPRPASATCSDRMGQFAMVKLFT